MTRDRRGFAQQFSKQIHPPIILRLNAKRKSRNLHNSSRLGFAIRTLPADHALPLAPCDGIRKRYLWDVTAEQFPQANLMSSCSELEEYPSVEEWEPEDRQEDSSSDCTPTAATSGSKRKCQ